MTPPPDTDDRAVELEELTMQPGTYFNPQTEVVVVVDDSTSLDQEVFNMEAYEGVDWVRISEDVPVDEDRRDVLLEEFQTRHHPAVGSTVSETALDHDDDDQPDDEEPDPPPAAAPDPVPEDEG